MWRPEKNVRVASIGCDEAETSARVEELNRACGHDDSNVEFLALQSPDWLAGRCV
jgi:hypothetical protein